VLTELQNNKIFSVARLYYSAAVLQRRNINIKYGEIPFDRHCKYKFIGKKCIEIKA